MSGLRPPVPGSADAQPSAGGAGSDGVGDRAQHRRDDGGLALHDGGCPHQAEASVSINLSLTDYYAEELLDFSGIDWPERTVVQQRNWIGKSIGVEFAWHVDGQDESFRVFTTR